jgi:large subunit ribosomal protein L4
MKADIYEINNLNKKAEGSIDLPDSIFAIEPNFNVIKSVINWQLAKRRSGSHKVKTVSEVSGTTAKPFKQKGTGRARQGSLRSVQMRGGGVIFGPVVRDHGYKLNKKVRKLGLNSALSYLLNEKRIKVIKDPKFTKPETSKLANSVKGSGKTLFVYNDQTCDNFKLSAYNIKDVSILNVSGLNVYDLVNSKNVIFCESSIKSFVEKVS